MPAYELHVGDAAEVLPRLPSGFARTCVTSPPYYKQRDYGVDGQLGHEDTPEAYVARLVGILEHVGRALTPDGTLWLNIGDSHDKRTGALNLVPQRLALALDAAGWLVTQEVIWHKPNAMPDPGSKRRPGMAHEYVFMCAKGPAWHYNAEAILEPLKCPQAKRVDFGGKKHAGQNGNSAYSGRGYDASKLKGRRARSVWTVSPAANPKNNKHLAVMASEIARRCIASSSAPGDVVLDPFAGSCTTGVVALGLGRRFVGVELSPLFAEQGVSTLFQTEQKTTIARLTGA